MARSVKLDTVKRQPVLNIETSCEYRISSVQPTIDGNQVYVGDSSGALLLYDLRNGRRGVLWKVQLDL